MNIKFYADMRGINMNWNGVKRYCKDNFGFECLEDDSLMLGVYNDERILIGLLNDDFLRISIWVEYVNDRNICKALACSNQYMVGGILKHTLLDQYTITHCLSMDSSYEEFGEMVLLLMMIARGLEQDLKG